MLTDAFQSQLRTTLAEIERDGLYKRERFIDSPQDAVIRLQDGRAVLNMCANNYLGLANHPDVVQAGIDALQQYGAGTASVRFICGTFTPHHTLEHTIADYMEMFERIN